MQIIPISIKEIKRSVNWIKKEQALTGTPMTKEQTAELLKNMVNYELKIYQG
jgi:hypothetical protein